jgi:PHD/YefM family antitoxin component YafN of YafNO toxin-antitoxin module
MKAVLAEKQQFIVDNSGKRVGVLLDLPTYERLREAAEDNADLLSYRNAKPRIADEIARGEYETLAVYANKRAKRK